CSPLLYSSRLHVDLSSFPTRRSSDLQCFIGIQPAVVPASGNDIGEDATKHAGVHQPGIHALTSGRAVYMCRVAHEQKAPATVMRSEEHTSELQSRFDLVCRLLLEKKN